MKFRKAEPEDCAAIAEMWHLGWHAGHAEHVSAQLVATRTRAEFDDRTQAHLERTVVGEIDGHLAGFYMLKDDELYQFYIGAAFRGTDAATLQMTQVEQALAGR